MEMMIAVAGVSLLAAISPGPDFFIVLRNSLVYSRRKGVFTVLGVLTALFAHLTYTLVGIGLLINESPFIYDILKYVGAAYLLYIGSKGIIGSFKKDEADMVASAKKHEQLSSKQAFMQGFYTNLLNPKCALFFVSLFSQFITADTTAFEKLAYAGINWSITFVWFVSLVMIVTSRGLYSKLQTFRSLIDRVMGSTLLLLGAKLLFI